MKKYIFIIFLGLLVGLWLYYGNSEQEYNSLQANVINTQSSLDSVTNSEVLVSSTISSVASPIQNQPKPYDGWPSELSEEYKNWKRSRGYFSDVDLQEYKGFKLDQLEDLANKGDLRAITVLMEYELSSRNIERYRELKYLGAVYGSMRSISLLTTEKGSEYIKSRKEEDALEFFSYMQLDVKRGNLHTKYTKIPTAYKQFNFYPNEEQANYIDRRSDELMADLENRRKELGLPPFDNTPSEIEKETYEDN